MKINQELKRYIEKYIFPQYQENEKGHGLDHIKFAIERCDELSKDRKEINKDMLFTIAAYHDIGHHIDAKNHEIISAQIMFDDENLHQFFTKEQRIIMKEAIEDHRASLEGEPRSIYGKLISSADKNISVEKALERTYYYGKKHHPNLTEEELIERSHRHLTEKFGINGYADFFVEDETYNQYLENLRNLLSDKKKFKQEQQKVIKKIEVEKEEIWNIFYGKEKWEVWKQFQEIENSIEDDNCLYSYIEEIKRMLVDEKPYIKMRGFRLICKLSKWDKENKINEMLDCLLNVLEDEKPTIVRQCLSSLNNLLLYKPELSDKVEEKLRNLNLSKYKDSMSPLLKKDIDLILNQL